MKLNTIILLCLSLFVYNCSNSDDSEDMEQNISTGEIELILDLGDLDNAVSFKSTNHNFEIPCDFGEFEIINSVTVGNLTLEALDINVPAQAIYSNDSFGIDTVFPDGLGNDLISSVSLRINGTNYIATSGLFFYLSYSSSQEQQGLMIFGCTADLTIKAVGSSETRNIRINIEQVGKGNMTSC